MTATELPDGLYVQWRGRTRRAHEAEPPAAVLTQLDPGEQAPARYERDEGWIIVPESELDEMFRLRTYALWEGMRCPVYQWISPERIQLSTPLIGSKRATALGLVPTLERGIYAGEVALTDVTEVRQERTDIPLAPTR
jgi:hypothetical protein